MTDEKTIIRVEKNKDNPFVMIDRRPLEKPYMSWKAKGLLAYLLSRPDNWSINFGDLVKRSTDGEYATRAAAKELQDTGHLEVKRHTNEKGQVIQYEYIVHEYPLRGFPQVGNPNVGNLDINNNDINKKDNSNIVGASAPKQEPVYEPCTEDGLEIPKKKKKTSKAVKDVYEIELYKSAIYPRRSVDEAIRDIIIEAIGKVEHRLKRTATLDDIKPFYSEWVLRGYNKYSAKWLTQWAVNGVIPEAYQPKQKATAADFENWSEDDNQE